MPRLPEPTAVAPDAASCDVGPSPAVEQMLRAARAAQERWAAIPLRARLTRVRRARHLLVERAAALTEAVAVPQRAGASETLAAEIIPLADACRFLERQARRVLATRRLGRRGRPAWLAGVSAEVRREPYGVVLIIGPSNYPVFLPGVQALHALTAGNAVVLKPGRLCSRVTQVLAELLRDAGFDSDLVHVLPEDPASAQVAMDAGVDKVVLTGSAATGQAVLERLARHGTPTTMELSGCDAVFILNGADLERAVRAVAFGLRLNGSATCIAPRRVFVEEGLADEFERRLVAAVRRLPPVAVDARAERLARTLTDQALAEGARLSCGEFAGGECRVALVVAHVRAEMRLAQSDVFAPVVSLIRVRDVDEALRYGRECPYALGATVFGPRREAEALAQRLDVGCVVINDMIAPTADPRVPFGGRRRSGFGVTRGAEGLLEMTRPKTVLVQRRRWLPHLEDPHPEDAELLGGYLRAAHAATLGERIGGAWRMIRAAMRQGRSRGAGF